MLSAISISILIIVAIVVISRRNNSGPTVSTITITNVAAKNNEQIQVFIDSTFEPKLNEFMVRYTKDGVEQAFLFATGTIGSNTINIDVLPGVYEITDVSGVDNTDTRIISGPFFASPITITNQININSVSKTIDENSVTINYYINFLPDLDVLSLRYKNGPYPGGDPQPKYEKNNITIGSSTIVFPLDKGTYSSWQLYANGNSIVSVLNQTNVVIPPP
jgi:hypothetical protein